MGFSEVTLELMRYSLELDREISRIEKNISEMINLSEIPNLTPAERCWAEEEISRLRSNLGAYKLEHSLARDLAINGMARDNRKK